MSLEIRKAGMELVRDIARKVKGLAGGSSFKLLICLVGLAAGQLLAQPASGQFGLPSNNRYLLIVEVSKGMETRARGTLKAVQELVKSGMNGQMKAGDTLGVWTYDAELYTGRFPLQRWTPEGQKAITTRVASFLRGQKYVKAARLDQVLEAMAGVIKNSELITVIVVSSGEGEMRGTPYDERINEFYRRWREKQAAERMPFIIVLRARNGQITDYTLNRPPWAVQMPYLPVEPQVVTPAPSPVPKPAPAIKPPTAAPLIVSGKKSKPQPAAKAEAAAPPKPEPAAPASTSEAVKQEGPPVSPTPTTKPEAVKAETVTVKVEVPAASPSAATNASTPTKVEPAKVEPPKALPAAAEAAKTEAGPIAPIKAATEVPPTAAPETPKPTPKSAPETVEAPKSVPAPEVKAAPVSTPETKPIQVPKPAPAVAEAPKAASAPEPKTVSAPTPPATLEAPKPATTAETKAPPAPAPPVTPTQATKPAPQAVAAPKPPPAREPKAVPALVPPTAPAVAASSGSGRPPDVRLSVTQAHTNASAQVTPREDARPPGVEAVAAPTGSFFAQKHIWFTAIALAAVMIGIALLLLRRSRGTPPGSLITRSLDREKKP
jgi:hypothetical protein